MTIRPRRAAHVKPRQPADLGARTKTLRSVRGDAVRPYRPVRSSRAPFPAHLILAAAVVCFALVMYLVGTGFATRLASGIGSAFGEMVSRAVPQPTFTAPPSAAALDTPVLDQPDNDGYVNATPVTVTGTIPREVMGKTGYSVRILAIRSDATRITVGEAGVGGTVRFSVPDVPLNAGVNTFVAQLVGPQGALEESQPIAYTLDTTPPSITVSSPANNAQIKAATANITGKTDPGATVTARNSQSTVGVNAVAADDGTFKLSVGLIAGTNTIVVTATDKAGNAKSVNLTLRRNLGQLAAHLTVSPTRIDTRTPVKVTLTVRLTSSDGTPLAGGQAVFTLNVPGLGPITSPTITTDGTGTARFAYTVSGATAGTGTAAVMVTTPTKDTISDRASITTFGGP